MNSNISVSKGVFVFKNNLRALKQKTRKSINVKSFNLNIYSEELWYQAYIHLWKNIERRIEILNKDIFSSILTNLVNFVKNSYDRELSEIPTAVLLTGINMPDHVVQFTTLIGKIKQDVSPHVACLYSQDCHNVKTFVENMINQFVSNSTPLNGDEFEYESDNRYKIKKAQLNFSTLQAWYEREHNVDKEHKTDKHLRKYQRKALVVIIPDFESFNGKILQEFILISSAYINVLPFIFVFGVATSLSILHKTLPYHVSSKVNIQYFNSQSSTVYLNNILENVLLTDECAFHLGGKVFNLLMDVFLFYDLSVTGFIKRYKYAMLEHFSYGNLMSLCCRKNTSDIINQFDHEECESFRNLISFRSLVENESYINRIKLLTDDEYFKSVLNVQICKIQRYLNTFHLFLKCFSILVADLPENSLGKQIRELYSKVVTSNIRKTEGYRTYIQLLQLQSKTDLENKISEIIELIEEECKLNNPNREMLKADLKQITLYLDEMENSEIQAAKTDTLVQERENINTNNLKERKHFREMLQKGILSKKPSTSYETIKVKLVKYMDSLFEKYLYCPTKLHFHEIFFFDDGNIEDHVIGTHRAATHTALNDPHHYLQCKCCQKRNDASILKTMPDICIVYKLHLEYGKMINLYDWLQAFVSIISPVPPDEDEDEETNIDPVLQARFTAAVAELEFLGFIKSSKRKSDHVQRLTWGG